MPKGSLQARLGEGDWRKYAHHAAPLFKWAGGKRRFILGNSNLFPEFSGTYHEPFAGSLAVYFWMASKSELPLAARLSDVNLRLVRTYQEIKFNPQEVSNALSELVQAFLKSTDPSGFYYRVRDDFNSTNPKGDAPRFIFLMATGWNGVYRTNSKGQYNVPFGGTNKPAKFPSREDIFVASVVLKQADLRACSWETSLAATSPGDFVFLDPPYLVSNDKDSNIYERNKAFTFGDHERLAEEVARLQERGVGFMLTNSASKNLLKLYRDLGLSVDVVAMRRSINSKTDERGEEAELIVTPRSTFARRQIQEDDFDLNIKLMGRKKEKNVQ